MLAEWSRRRGGRRLVIPAYEELIRGARRAVAESLRVAAGEEGVVQC